MVRRRAGSFPSRGSERQSASGGVRSLHAEHPEEIQTSTAKVADVTTANLEAWRHYVQGLKGEDAMRDGIALDEYRKAVAIDPGFALAHYRIAYVGERMGVDAETRRAAIEAAGRAGTDAPRTLVAGISLAETLTFLVVAPEEFG